MVPVKYSTMTEQTSPFSLSKNFQATPGRMHTRPVTMSNPISSPPPSERAESVYTEITEHSSSIVAAITNVKTSLRVRVINQVSNLFKDILVEIRNDVNLFEAIYDKPQVKKANIRKWGSAVTKQVKSGSHEIRCSIWDDEVDSPCHTYSIDDMKQTTTRELYCLVGPESELIKLKLHCVEKKAGTLPVPTKRFDIPTLNELKSSNHKSLDLSAGKRYKFDRDSSSKSRFSNSISNSQSNPGTFSSANDTVSELDENDNSTIRTSKSMGQSVLEGVLEAFSTMRVKITNESSKRHKNLVINISPTLTVHESIYNHKSVKTAQVRKWTSDVVKGVKKKVKEVQCVVLDGTPDKNVYASFSIDELKTLKTKDLFDLVPMSDPVELVLRCVDVKKKVNLTSQGSLSATGHSSRKSTRPNHMNLSAPALNNSSSSFGDSSGSKSLSIAETNATFAMEDKIPKPSCLRPRSAASMKRYSEPQKMPSANKKFGREAPLKESGDRKSTTLKQTIATLLESTESSDNSFDASHRAQRTSNSSLASIADDQRKLNEYKRLCRSKKGSEFQSGDNLDKLTSNDRNHSLNSAVSNLGMNSFQSASEIRNASLKQSLSDMRNASMKSFNKAFNEAFTDDKRNHSMKLSATFETRETSNDTSLSDLRDVTFKSSSTDLRNSSVKTIGSGTTMSMGNHSFNSSSKSPATKKLTGSDKISRFLEFSAKRKMPAGEDSVQPAPLNREESQKSASSMNANIPPVAEIAVFKGHSSDESKNEEVVKQPSIPLSGDLVKQVFPYHIVIDEEFMIVQVGNSLHQLMESEYLIGKCISDIFTITSPIPSFGKKWDWKSLDTMKEKTIFLEGLHVTSSLQKPKIKGSIIELAKKPKRQILLALSPNVKNLSELEAMNLSMQDLPLHSCQRDAVLLGEHSKSEVKLTNHLDQLHRDLIDSMEKQIEDRTNELASANTNLESANAQLAVQSAKQLEHFACMSHEIRTPLNCIVGMSSLLLEDSAGPSMDPMHADSIRMINTSGELLRAVVDDVLDYAKLESGSFEVDIKSTKLQETLDSVLYSISQKVQDKNIRVRTHFSPTVPEYIETDSRRLQQVLFNLLGNAGKFSKKDSVIDLSVGLVKATSPSGRDVIRFSIRDYGKGIEKKDFETIFQPFSQASKETQNIYGGTGLGLSITSKLVKRLGGTISLDSEYGKFADFTVDLPMNGTYIEVEKISKSLKNTTIVFLEPKQMHEREFGMPRFKAEPSALDSGVVDIFGLDVMRCHSFDELKEKVSAQEDAETRKHFSLLVHETLYESCSAEKLASLLGKSRHSVITYGANFLGDKTRTSHMKSVTALFPATLLQSIAKHVSEQKRSKTRAKRSPTKKGTSSRSLVSKSDASSTTSSKTGNSDRNDDFRKNMKVLYAEDNLVNQKVLSRVLQRSGISDITIVDNGKKAVDISATVKYDCILLDMQMPVMDGMEACKIIMERDPDTIIVFVTAHALDEFKAKAKAAGAKGFISKPFRVGDIDKVLKEICNM